MSARWSVVQAVLCLVAGAGALALHALWPLAETGGASLFIFFVLARPRMTRLFGLGVANAVTLVRVAVLVGAAVMTPAWWSFGLVFALDGLDGFLARRLDEAAPFGAHFDMETDALLVALLSVAAVLAGAPAWALTLGALRYVYVLARAFRPPRVITERRSTFGRSVFSITVCALLLSLTPAPEPLKLAALAIALGCLLVSFAPDFAALRG